MEGKFYSALIATIITLIGIIINFYIHRKKIKLNEKEIEINTEKLKKEIDLNLEQIKQGQYNIILEKRMMAYQALWEVTLKYDKNWYILNKPTDIHWAKKFLEELNRVNELHGVFFSESVYEKFHLFRNQLIDIYDKLNSGIKITQEDLITLARLNTGHGTTKGLGTVLKNDLGSYGSMHLGIIKNNNNRKHY